MKKITTTLSLAALFALSAQADIIRMEAGLGIWQADPSGTITSNTGISDNVNLASNLAYDEENIDYAWFLLKHPAPAVPNMRIEYTDLAYSGALTTSVDWKGTTYTASGTSDLNLEQFDATAYYNILDNTGWATVDLGLNVKYIDASFKLRDGANNYNEAEKLAVPMGYARVRFEVPATDLGIESDLKYISYSDSKFYDFRIKADYTFSMVPAVQPALEIGYREMRLDIDEDDFDIKGDIEFSGFYAGLMLRF